MWKNRQLLMLVAAKYDSLQQAVGMPRYGSLININPLDTSALFLLCTFIGKSSIYLGPNRRKCVLHKNNRRAAATF